HLSLPTAVSHVLRGEGFQCRTCKIVAMTAAIQNYGPPGSSHTIVEIVILVCVQRFVVTAKLFPKRLTEARKRDCIDCFLLWATSAEPVFRIADSERMRNGCGDSVCDERRRARSHETRHSHRSGFAGFQHFNTAADVPV